MRKLLFRLALGGFILYAPGLFGQGAEAVPTRINVSRAIDTLVRAEPLSHTVNSPYIESGPMLTKDGKVLYFSRAGHPGNIGGVKDQDIWSAEFDEASQNWLEAINIGAPLNNKGPNFLCGVGWKGDTVLVGNAYGKGGKMSAGVSIAIKDAAGVWSYPMNVFLSNDYNLAPRVGYDLSHDRKALVIAQQKADTKGKMDLYVSFRDPTKPSAYAATESVNLGDIINSTGNESSPFLAYDGATLFFSSDGHKGYGGEDIFMSRRLDDTWTRWSKPENLGSGINTVYDDSYFGFTPTSRYAFYSKGLSPENADIYKIELTYLFKDIAAAIKNLEHDKAAIVLGQTQVVRSVFEDNKSSIRDESQNDLLEVKNYLLRYKAPTVYITVHSNEHATRDESFNLSKARIESIKAYLTGSGIAADRIHFKGYGHDIVVNTTDPANRKTIAGSVEFKFTGNAR